MSPPHAETSRGSDAGRTGVVIPARHADEPGIRPPDDRFFRQLVVNMRNGVIAIRRDGTIALMNDEAYRIFALARRADDVGAPFNEVFRERPDVCRVLSGAFEMTSTPNRAELRLKDIDRVIGYTLSQVKDEASRPIGAVMFFKDLTLVEQAVKRDRLRDRLASLGEMAAGIAHELKNPLAGIKVMAGLLRRQVPDSADAQSLLADIISEAKLANAIVVEMLEFVRPIRLQVERTNLAEVLQHSMTLAESRVTRGEVSVTVNLDTLPSIKGDRPQTVPGVHESAQERLRGAGGPRPTLVDAVARSIEQDPAFTDSQPPTSVIIVDVIDDGPGMSLDVTDIIFDPFYTTKPQGSGLGLPNVRKIVDAHDGRIDVKSEPGRGTRFRVTLPVASASSWFK